MRYLLVILTAVFLTACNVSELSAKLMPENIQAMAKRDIDAVFAGDASKFQTLQGEMSDEDFDAALKTALARRSTGEEISRNITSANISTSASIGEGTSGRYEAVYEIQTQDGFTVVELVYV